MMRKSNICILFSTDIGGFDEYWEGKKLRENQTIATVHRYTTATMVAYGLLENLDIYAGVPYVMTRSTQPNGGKFTGASGFQDVMIAAKYEAYKGNFSIGELSLLASAGFSTPISNYLSDYMPYSLGHGAPEVSARGIVQFTTNSGIYFRTSVAHLWRGYTEAERNYYYNDGSYYTAWMDVPNAWNYEGVFGAWFFKKSLKAEVNYSGLKSTSGDDIRAYNAAQPTNRVKTDRVGLNLQYYLPNSGFGAVVYHSRVIEGQNTAKMNNTGVGLTYQFSFKKKNHEE
ncbi:MAG: transporter [Flavobacteriaceae bacterium]|nr:transporter [Flavobacteriaceae bacterium]